MDFPLGKFVCVTGVSGSGKSTLVNDILYKAVAQQLPAASGAGRRAQVASTAWSTSTRSSTSTSRRSAARRAPTPRPTRALHADPRALRLGAGSQDSRLQGRPVLLQRQRRALRGVQGEGIIQIEMHFLPDVYVPCEVCKGKRYNREALEIKFKGKSIADVLDMTVEEALEHLREHAVDRQQAAHAA